MRNGGLPWNREVPDKSQTPEKATSASCLASPCYSLGLLGLDTTCCFLRVIVGFVGSLQSLSIGVLVLLLMVVDLDSSGKLTD